jgi:cardiolipin synthase A/B
MFNRYPRHLTSAISIAATVAAAAMGIAAAPATPAGASAAPSASGTYTLYTEPAQGFSPFYDLVNGAKTSIDLTMYELEDTTAEKDLVAAEKRGVDVRVILDQRQEYYNSAAYSYLKNNGVHVVYSWSKYYYTHEKSMVIDNATAMIMSANLTSQYYSTSRDFLVTDTNAADVAAIVKVFNADYAHDSITPGDGTDLVWSPTDSQEHLLALINGASSTLRLYANEMDDTAIENALISAAKRGVNVEVCGENEDGEYDSAYTTLTNAGVHITYYSNPDGFYIHAKMILADYGKSDAKVFIGSENFSNTSLNENRELGLIISDDPIMASVSATFATDFKNGTPWTG